MIRRIAVVLSIVALIFTGLGAAGWMKRWGSSPTARCGWRPNDLANAAGFYGKT